MPLDPKLNKFSTASPVLASFPAPQIADGTGTIIFNGFVTKQTTTSTYKLTSDDVLSNDPTILSAFNSAGWVKKLDLDFDLSAFNMPRTISGTSYVSMGIAAVSGSGGVTGEVYVIAKVRKWDGSSETEIASAQTETLSAGSNGLYDNEQKIMVVKITIPETLFAEGETLRLTMEGWCNTNSAIELGTDPQNNDSDSTYINPSSDTPTTTTTLKLNMPFKLDI